VDIYGTSFSGNTASSGYGDDIYMSSSISGTVKVHETCPSPYFLNSAIEGSALSTFGMGNVENKFSYSGCAYHTCSAGQYNPTRGNSGFSCLSCVAGRYSNSTGAASSSTCKKCSAGKSSISTGASSSLTCVLCSPGSFSEAGFAYCSDCEPGKYTSAAGATKCDDCGLGKFSSTSGATACSSCIEGKYSQSTGVKKCSDCAEGTYSSSKGASSCNNCPAGTFSSLIAATNCSDCSAEKFSAVVGASSESMCLECYAGKYSNSTGATSASTCTKCPNGKTSKVGSTSSDSCTFFDNIQDSSPSLISGLVGGSLLIIAVLIMLYHHHSQAFKASLEKARVSPAENGIQDEFLDRARMLSLANIMKNTPQEYSADEKNAINEGTKFYIKYKENENAVKIKSPDEMVEMEGVFDGGGSLMTGVAKTTVDATLEECAAYVYTDIYSRETRKNTGKINYLVDKQVKHINQHSCYYFSRQDFGFPAFKQRQFMSKVIWTNKDEGIIIYLYDTDEKAFPLHNKAVLASAHSIWYFKPMDYLGDIPQTAVTYIIEADMKGRVPASFANLISPKFVSIAHRLRLKFDKSEQREALKTGEGKLSRNTIDPSLFVNSFEIEFERDTKGDKVSLGRGAFGMVLLVKYSGTKCAYKEMVPEKMEEDNVERFFEELKLIGNLRHPNIAQCLGVVWEPEEHGIMFELCKNGGLDDFLKKYAGYGLLSWTKDENVLNSQRKMTSQQNRNRIISEMLLKGVGIKTEWALQIAKGCAFLHAKHPSIIHRDLKCANVLVSDDLKAKITDFGESRSACEDDGTMTSVGTPYFMAPEVFSADSGDKYYGTEVDVYSFGVMLLEIFFDGNIKKAFRNLGGMIVMNRVSKGWRPDLKKVEEEDQHLAETIKECWAHKPEDRPTFMEIIEFFEGKKLEAGLGTKFQTIKPSEKLSKTLEPAKKSNLAEAQPMRKSLSDKVSVREGFDPMDIFEMAKAQKEREMNKKKEAEKGETVKIDPRKALFAMAAGGWDGGAKGSKEDEKTKAERAEIIKLDPGKQFFAQVKGQDIVKADELQGPEKTSQNIVEEKQKQVDMAKENKKENSTIEVEKGVEEVCSSDDDYDDDDDDIEELRRQMAIALQKKEEKKRKKKKEKRARKAREEEKAK